MKAFLLLIILTLSFSTYGQSKKTKKIAINERITFAAIDRPGDLYIITESGQIQKFDKDGRLLNLFKNPKTSAITSFDPRDGSLILLYRRSDQEVWFLNPSLEIRESYVLDASVSTEPWLVTTAGDHDFWIFDAEEMSLKKLNRKSGQVENEFTIAHVGKKMKENFSSLREYQGFIFLLNREHGIMIFNKLGNLLRTITAPGIHYYNFLGAELYYLENGRLKFFDLFTAESRELLLPMQCEYVILSDERMFLMNQNEINIFEFYP